MRIFVVFLVIAIILVSGCVTENDKLQYSHLKNPNLTYSWDFNESISGGGHTFNSTYFQLKKYNWIEENILSIIPCEIIPYEINYKHEEGHIYHNQLLKIENFDEFEYNKFNSSNLNISYDNFRQFSIIVSEGIADYYLISYFNNSLSNSYFNCIEMGNKENNSQFKQHYQGIKFVYYALNNKLYSNFTDLILDLDSVKQYNYYSNFIESL